MASYCTLAQARAAGAVGTDAEVTAAVAEASARVDAHTRTIFDSRALTVEAQVHPDGYARLPLPALAVTEVAYEAAPDGTPTALAATSWRLDRASTPGDTDSLQVGGYGSSLDTVGGAERWRQGLHAAVRGSLRVRVTGTFGREAVPLSVQRATAVLAAALTGGGGSTVNAEGDATLPRVPELVQGLPAEAAELLVPYRRATVRLG